MTIIYEYQNSRKRRKPIIYYSSGKSYIIKNNKSFAFKNRLNLNNYFGYIKPLAFLFGPFVLIFVFWILLYGQNINLDFQIYKLKERIKATEEKLADLQAEVADNDTILKITQWSKENGFVKVNNVSYLNLKEDNLAQSPSVKYQ